MRLLRARDYISRKQTNTNAQQKDPIKWALHSLATRQTHKQLSTPQRPSRISQRPATLSRPHLATGTTDPRELLRPIYSRLYFEYIEKTHVGNSSEYLTPGHTRLPDGTVVSNALAKMMGYGDDDHPHQQPVNTLEQDQAELARRGLENELKAAEPTEGHIERRNAC